jgi:hypothetical protein
MEDSSAPLIETQEKGMLFTGNCMVKIFINLTVSGIQTSVPDHFEMFNGFRGR